jgi:hypothetical protein
LKTAEASLDSPDLFQGYYCFMLFTKLKSSLVESFREIVAGLPHETTDFQRLSHKFSLHLISQCRQNMRKLSEKAIFEKISSALSNSNFEQNQQMIVVDDSLAKTITSDFTVDEMDSQRLLDQIRSTDQVHLLERAQ